MGKIRSAMTVVTVKPAPGRRTQGILRLGPLVLRCALGRSGATAFKREGDGATPVARLQLVRGHVKSWTKSKPQTLLQLKKIRAADGWCDASGDRNYNRPVRLPYAASAEAMLRKDSLYDVCLVLDWNLRRRVQGRGSAIFLHIAKPDYLPTEGCIAVRPRDMARLLPYLGRNTVLRVLG